MIAPRTPQMNGMVERFNGRISKVLQQTRFASAAELASTLQNHLKLYNHHIPQRALEHIAPVDAMSEWCKNHQSYSRKKFTNRRRLTSAHINSRSGNIACT